MQTPAIEPEGQADWNAIDWQSVNRRVRNLRQRIFKAERVDIRTASGLLEPDALSGARPVLRRLRHEVAYVLVAPDSLGRNSMFCH